jgi:hypothetical protein
MLATAALWVLIQTSLKNIDWTTSAKEWPTRSSPPKKIYKKYSGFDPVKDPNPDLGSDRKPIFPK